MTPPYVYEVSTSAKTDICTGMNNNIYLHRYVHNGHSMVTFLLQSSFFYLNVTRVFQVTVSIAWLQVNYYQRKKN